VVRGVLTNSATQGIAIAAGLQKKFDWTGIATAGVMSGAGGIVSRSIGGQAQNNPFNADGSRNVVYAADGTINKGGYMPASSTNGMISGAAGGLAGAAARSLVTGTDFGDNIVAVLPDVIGQTVGSIIGRTLTAPKAPPKLKVDKSAYGLDDDRVTSPPYLVADNTGFITDGSVTYTQNAGLFNASGKLTGQVSAQQAGQARSSILGSAQKARAALAATSSRTDKAELVWHNGVGEWVGSGGMGRIEALAQNMFDSNYMKWLPGEYKDGAEFAAHLDYLLRQGQEEQRFNTVLILGYQASKADSKYAGFYRDTAENLVALDPAARQVTFGTAFGGDITTSYAGLLTGTRLAAGEPALQSAIKARHVNILQRAPSRADIASATIGPMFLAPVFAAAAATPAGAAYAFGEGTKAFYAATIVTGGGLNLGLERSKNAILGQPNSLGGDLSAIAFGSLGGTGFSFVRAGGSTIGSLSRFTGLSTERIASTGNGFVYGALSDGSGQLLNIANGQHNRFNLSGSIRSGLFGSVGGAMFPQYHGFGAESKLNVSVYQELYRMNGRSPLGATPWLKATASGRSALPNAVLQGTASTATEIGIRRAIGR
jgi:hypothetical protein